MGRASLYRAQSRQGRKRLELQPALEPQPTYADQPTTIRESFVPTGTALVTGREPDRSAVGECVGKHVESAG